MTARPDAAKIPASLFADQADDDDRKGAVVSLAEDLLGIDLAGDELAWCSLQQPGDFYFCTRDIGASLYHPSGSPRAGLPRYDWTPAADGCELGVLNG